MNTKGFNIQLSLLAGLFASTGSVFAKFAGFYEFSDPVGTLAKLGLLLAMVTANTIGCTLYVRALAGSGSSLPATVATSTVNYLCSAILGQLLFGETTTALWWSGTGLVLLGLLLICHSPPQPAAEKKEKAQ